MHQTTLTNNITPIDAECARLYAAGKTYSEAWRLTHPGSRAKPEAVRVAACRLFAKANVQLMIDDILKAANLEAILAPGQHLRDMISHRDLALEASNSTAAASYDKAIAQCLRMTAERVFVGVEKSETDDELVTRLAGGDAHRATMLRAIIGKDSFT